MGVWGGLSKCPAAVAAAAVGRTLASVPTCTSVCSCDHGRIRSDSACVTAGRCLARGEAEGLHAAALRLAVAAGALGCVIGVHVRVCVVACVWEPACAREGGGPASVWPSHKAVEPVNFGF